MGCPVTCTGCGRNAALGIPRGCSSPGNPLYCPACISAPSLSASPSAACSWRACCCASRAHNPNPNSAVPGRGASRRRGTISGISMRSGTMKERLIIFDTTMRDGEQSPGASMTKDEKLRIARQLERMRVDVIEAGFPASSNGDFEAVQGGAGGVKDSTGGGLCRAHDRDVPRGGDALEKAETGGIHPFIATSALPMEKKMRMTPEQVLEQATLSVRFARKHRDDIEFSPEDGSRSDPDFLCRVLEAVIKEGANTISIPDTVGYAVPEQFGEFIRKLRERVPNSDKAVWSVHCHNDLGMAVANSLAAVMIGGARQIECTMNGLGERAGNTSLEEVVMAVRTRRDFFNLPEPIHTVQDRP